MTAGVVGALGAMVAIRDRALKGGSFHGSHLLGRR
jgi:hypothetical protein